MLLTDEEWLKFRYRLVHFDLFLKTWYLYLLPFSMFHSKIRSLSLLREDPFSSYSKHSQQILFLNPRYAQGVRNYVVRNNSFSENFAYVLNG